MSTPERDLPLTILAGYLGAGKTTLVNHLLRHSGRRLAVLVNEFGDLAIDADLIEAEGEDLIALAGGCVCCSYGDDLMEALIGLTKLDPTPEHVILESSGVALPQAIAASVGLVTGMHVAGIVVLTDAERIVGQLRDEYIGDTIERQIKAADLFVMTKADLSDPDPARAALERHAPTIPIIDKTNIAPDTLLADHRTGTAQSPSQSHSAKHQTETLPMAEPVDAADLAQSLAADPRIVRAKGHVRDVSGPLLTLQVVGDRAEVVPAPKGAEPGVVVIRR